jgi:hypothetical protein
MQLKRLVIYAKDIQRITGRSDRYTRELLKRIREKFNKQRHHPVTRSEFCEYMNMKEEEIDQYLSH